MTIALRALSLVEKAEPVKFALHYARGTDGVGEPEMDVKVYVDSYMASNGPCFMVTWNIFKNHLLVVGLTQNWENAIL